MSLLSSSATISLDGEKRKGKGKGKSREDGVGVVAVGRGGGGWLVFKRESQSVVAGCAGWWKAADDAAVDRRQETHVPCHSTDYAVQRVV
jgi:hypothetical protein